MTEQEAINRIKYRIATASEIVGIGENGNAFEEFDMAIKALEEVQQYRAIGTPDKIKEELDRLRNDNDCQGLYFTLEERQDLARQHRELEEYKAIGTPDECRAAVEKLRKVEEVVKEWDKVGYAYSNNHMCEIKMIVKGGGVDE